MRRIILAIVLGLLVLPVLCWAGEARKRALAAGDERLIPDDASTYETFPGRINEHHEIQINNIDPNGTDETEKAAHGPVTDEFADERSWGQGTWKPGDEKDYTIGWAINRPSRGARLVHEFRSGSPAEHDPGAPQSIIDLLWGNEQYGLTAAVGTRSREFTVGMDQEKFRNSFIDVVAGMNMSSGMEGSVNFAWASIGELDDDEQSKSAIQVGANVRNETDLLFFNNWTASAGFLSGAKTSIVAADSKPNTIGGDLKLFRYSKADMGMGGGDSEDLTYLLAIGVGIKSEDSGRDSSDRNTTLQLPAATAGAELAVTSWLDLRGSVTQEFDFTFGDNDASGGSDLFTTVGASGHWGRLSIDAVLNNALFENGPNFIGGRAQGVANFVSATFLLP